MIDPIISSFYRFFVEPVLTNQGYNAINTSTYAILAGVILVRVPSLTKIIGITIDKYFVFSALSFTLLGSSLRALQDAAVVESFWLTSPMIYILVFLAFLAVTRIATALRMLTLSVVSPLIIGVGVAAFLSPLIHNLYPLYMLAIAAGILLTAPVLLPALTQSKWLNRWNTSIAGVHLLDGLVTYVALTEYSYAEQHVFPNLLISSLGPWSIFPLKIVIIIVSLFLVNRIIRNEQSNTVLKTGIIILGLGPALRGMLRLLMLV